MAKYHQGIMGQFSGAVGPVVGSKWKGIDIMRSKAAKGKKDPSPKQLANRERFAVAGRFNKCLQDLFNQTFSTVGLNMTGSNVEFQQVRTKALRGDFPDISLHYPSILISKGSLTNVAQAFTRRDGENIKFSWQDNSGTGNAEPQDKVIMVAYCEQMEHAVYTIGDAIRSDGSAMLPIPATYSGHVVHTWISFVSADGKETATSIYSGEIN